MKNLLKKIQHAIRHSRRHVMLGLATLSLLNFCCEQLTPLDQRR